MSLKNDHILTLSCPDKPGIIHAVTGIFATHKLNIVDLQQYSDPESERFFMRVHFGPVGSDGTVPLAEPFAALAREYTMTYEVRSAAQKTRVLILVSKFGHCLNDLLFRMRSGRLPIEVPLVVSNHPDLESMVIGHGVPFLHLPVKAETKGDQEARILSLAREHDVELVVLARYMQILSPKLCADLSGRAINIHHSFLPGFKGAKPYHQAHERGVKIIGATAHFVTADLDEGPIIEQRVARVDHSMSVRQLTDEGANIECQVLAAAVKWFAERRVFLNNSKTVIFA